LSHAEDLLLLAITRSKEIGIDIERLSEGSADTEIGRRYFSVGEFAAFSSLPGDQMAKVFSRFWTRKEAYLKAKGESLAAPLDHSFATGEQVPVQTAFSEESAEWCLEELHPGPGFVAALAVQGPAVLIRRWQWSLDLEETKGSFKVKKATAG
ncbi:MAG TPA: 4'-phosphopantetheinyl transferase superfamily protein, partial [Pyrinomonadaceae bacterium]|nr:4'-phosphopantetheinyl transferase superfamily protein [Pyrinomonadaceae bacterium]